MPDGDAPAAVSHALEAGYRHVDTAAIYRNEVGVGRAIAASSLPRDEIFVTTKLWNKDQGRDLARPGLEQSLEKLGLDHVDLYLIHWPCPARGTYVETWEQLIDFRSAGLARSIGDWLLGMNATRLYSLRFGGPGRVLSIGRVQTPTLALIVRRQREIEAFRPEPYWELKTVYRDVTFTASRGRFAKKEEGEALLLGGVCDAVAYGRELLRNPNFAQSAMSELGCSGLIENSYKRAFK